MPCRDLPNVTVLETVPNIDEVLSRARLLLMPSLWLEGFGLIAMEAMLRGLAGDRERLRRSGGGQSGNRIRDSDPPN